jgi:hypothetical protein
MKRKNQRQPSLGNTAQAELVGINTLLNQLGLRPTIDNREWLIGFWEGDIKWTKNNHQCFKAFSPDRVKFIQSQTMTFK